MEDFNKVISFILGLIVVVVALVIITRKYDFTKKLLPFSSNAKVTATPTPKSKVVSEVTVKGQPASDQSRSNYQVNNYQKQTTSTEKIPTTIPSTGAPTFLLPIYLSSLFIGLKLRKRN